MDRKNDGMGNDDDDDVGGDGWVVDILAERIGSRDGKTGSASAAAAAAADDDDDDDDDDDYDAHASHKKGNTWRRRRWVRTVERWDGV